MSATGSARLRRFIADMTQLVGGAVQDRDEDAIVEVGARLLADLVRHDDWLPELAAQGPPHGYAQNLLWCDPLERFSVVSFVCASGALTPVHDHCVWGLVGMLRGSETSQAFVRDPASGRLSLGSLSVLAPGDVEVLRPSRGDIHQVSNVLKDRSSISIHVYGGNIGAVRRHVYDSGTHEERPFVSGYTNRVVPNFWDRSTETRGSD
ncbi:MAG: cysteine dioxygenase [Alphaproteobacteria bacterium]|nr:cysteine dioxygenase [Alphaproteobacteria bacterium]